MNRATPRHTFGFPPPSPCPPVSWFRYIEYNESMLASLLIAQAIRDAEFIDQQRAIVVAAQNETLTDNLTIPELDSGKWKFATRQGVLIGTIQVETRSSCLFNNYAAVYGPLFLESHTPFRVPLTFSSAGPEQVPSDVKHLLHWCRRNLKSASFAELDTRLWVVLDKGMPEQGEEAVQLLTATYTRFKSREGMAGLIKHCVRSGGPGDPIPVIKAAKKLRQTLPKGEADSLAATLDREWPDWREV